jgi:hypothetical protein
MSSMSSGKATGRYIVRAVEPARLSEFVQNLRPDSGIELLDLIGPPGAPHTAVLAMAYDTAKALELHFSTSNQFTIEPDRPLSLFGDA